MLGRILAAATFLLLSPAFSVSFILSLFQPPSLITDSQFGLSLSLLKEFVCYCLIYTDADISLHCTAACSSINTVYGYQCVASFCWWNLSWTYTPSTAVVLRIGNIGHTLLYLCIVLMFGSFLLLPMHILRTCLCFLMSLQSVSTSKLVM